MRFSLPKIAIIVCYVACVDNFSITHQKLLLAWFCLIKSWTRHGISIVHTFILNCPIEKLISCAIEVKSLKIRQIKRCNWIYRVRVLKSSIQNEWTHPYTHTPRNTEWKRPNKCHSIPIINNGATLYFRPAIYIWNINQAL